MLTHILSVISVICAAHSLLSSMCGLWSVSLHNTCHLICWFASSCPVRCQWHYSVTNPIVQMWFVPWMTGTGYGRDICQFLGSGKQTSLAVFLNMIQSAHVPGGLDGIWLIITAWTLQNEAKMLGGILKTIYTMTSSLNKSKIIIIIIE